MIPRVRFGRTGSNVSRVSLGGYPFGGVNKARGWDPFSLEGRKGAALLSALKKIRGKEKRR